MFDLVLSPRVLTFPSCFRYPQAAVCGGNSRSEPRAIRSRAERSRGIATMRYRIRTLGSVGIIWKSVRRRVS